MPASGLLDFLRLSFLDMAQFIAHQRKLLLNLVIINEAKFVAVKKSVSLLISAKKGVFETLNFKIFQLSSSNQIRACRGFFPDSSAGKRRKSFNRPVKKFTHSMNV